MFRQLKKNLVATLIAALALGQVAPALPTLPTRCPIWEPRQEARFLSDKRCKWATFMCASYAVARR